ncbi:MAG TPA: hypothetical protein PKE03_09360 [Bacteroidales bacterium]|nr:hypothetical protein [Bacteroidales bacterium]
MKKLFFAMLLPFVIAACSGQQNDKTQQAEEQITEVTVGNFNTMAGELVGKTVMIKGTADHICKHDGKKLFLIDVNSEGRVKVVTGEDMAAFDAANEGLDFIVTGTVAETIVDEAYLQEWEESLKSEEAENPHLEDGQKAEEGEDHHSNEDAYEQIARYRQKMAEQGVDKLSFYHIVAISYEIEKE